MYEKESLVLESTGDSFLMAAAPSSIVKTAA